MNMLFHGRRASTSMGRLMTPTKAERQAIGPICVAIVEDDRATCEGLGLLIHGTPGFRCVGTFRSVEEGLSSRVDAPPHVILLDIDLPGMSGSDGVGVLKEKYPAAEIVMLTVYADQDKVFESICHGACGYLLKETPPAKLLEAITEAHRGGAPMSPEIARHVVNLFHRTGAEAKTEAQLAPQEVRLLQLLAEGYSYDGASHQLNISVNTVRNYIRSIYSKLHVHTKSEAVTKALRHRIIF